MNKYKVDFEGFAYVEADNENEAKNRFFDEEIIYSECGVVSIEQKEEFDLDI